MSMRVLPVTPIPSLGLKKKNSELRFVTCFRNHLQSTGNLELKTTTSEAFLADRRAEKMEKIKRDNLTISGDRILRTTHNDFKHFGNISSSEIRAIPPWFSEPKSKQIIIS